jgi:hypothetical protein
MLHFPSLYQDITIQNSILQSDYMIIRSILLEPLTQDAAAINRTLFIPFFFRKICHSCLRFVDVNNWWIMFILVAPFLVFIEIQILEPISLIYYTDLAFKRFSVIIMRKQTALLHCHKSVTNVYRLFSLISSAVFFNILFKLKLSLQTLYDNMLEVA